MTQLEPSPTSRRATTILTVSIVALFLPRIALPRGFRVVIGDSTTSLGGLVLWVVLTLAALHIARRAGSTAQTGLRAASPALKLLIASLFASTLFSGDPVSSLLRCLSMASILIVASALGPVISDRQAARVVVAGASSAVVASILMRLANPSAALSPDGYMLGVYTNQNEFGRVALFCGITVAISYGTQIVKYRALVPCGVAGVLLALSVDSAQVIVVLVVAGFAVLSAAAARRRLVPPAVLLSAIGTLLVVVAIRVIGNPESTVGTLSRDSGFTSRNLLWDELSKYVAGRPLRGYGVGAFWNQDRTIELWWNLGWHPAQAHNSFIDAALQAGVLASILLGVALVALALRGARQYMAGRGLGLLAIGISVYAMVYSLSASAVLVRNDWVLLSMVLLNIRLKFSEDAVVPTTRLRLRSTRNHFGSEK